MVRTAALPFLVALPRAANINLQFEGATCCPKVWICCLCITPRYGGVYWKQEVEPVVTTHVVGHLRDVAAVCRVCGLGTRRRGGRIVPKVRVSVHSHVLRRRSVDGRRWLR